MPFTLNKTSKELGLDTERKFVMIEKDPNANFERGDIVLFEGDYFGHPGLAWFRNEQTKMPQVVDFKHLEYLSVVKTKPKTKKIKEIEKGMKFKKGDWIFEVVDKDFSQYPIHIRLSPERLFAGLWLDAAEVEAIDTWIEEPVPSGVERATQFLESKGYRVEKLGI